MPPTRLSLSQPAPLTNDLLSLVSCAFTVASMAPSLKPIHPLPERWQPTPDPNDIVVPGLDTNAPIHDQIEQIEQLITIKLQVGSTGPLLSNLWLTICAECRRELF